MSTDGASKGYVDSNFYANTITLNNITAPTGSLNMNSQKITGLADATTTGDAVHYG